MLKNQETVTGSQIGKSSKKCTKTECLTGDVKKHPRKEVESISCKNGLRAVARFTRGHCMGHLTSPYKGCVNQQR